MREQYLSARLGSMWYGIALTSIIEVLHMVALAELPEATPDVLGLLTLRDHIMPVLDLRVRFHQPQQQLHLNTPIVAVRGNTEDQIIGFVFDEVDSVVILPENAAVKATNSPYLAGAVQLEAHMMLILDVPSFFATLCLEAS